MDIFWEYFLLLGAGFIGGFLNAVVSSGSAVTLPLLISFGIPPNIANATNRIPVVAGFVASTFQFHKKKLIDWKKTMILAAPLILGTIGSVLFVEDLPENSVKTIIILALCVSFFLAITKYKKLSIKKISTPSKITFVTYLLFVLLGFWGGVIVLDTATFILFSLMLHLGIDLIEANAIKSALCLIFSFVSLCLFYFNGDINWFYGGCLAVGSFGGGYVGSKFATSEKSRKWVFKFLITTLTFEILLLVYKSFIK
jgi:uncharacterized membrane protein YfcA